MQHDFDITNLDANTGLTFRAAVNAALQALASQSSGATEPTTIYPCQVWADTANMKLKVRNSSNTAWIIVGNLDEAEVVNARGTKSTLDQRLDVALNEDGTLKASTTLNPSQWYKPSLTFTYVSTTSFTVNGDQTDIYKSTRRLKCNLSGSTVYSEVVSATYSAPNTTVVIADAVLNNTLVDVDHSLFLPTKDNGALTKRMLDNVVTLTDAATINTDAAAGNIFKVTLAGNRTLAAPTNPNAGQQCTWVFTQDATGNRTITLDSIFRNRTGLSSITLSTAANAVDYMTCIYNSADSKWDVVNFSPFVLNASDSFVNKTANYTLVADDLTGRKKFTNSGAGATLVNFRAPTAAANYRTAIRVVDGVDNSGAGLRFIPEVTDTVFMGGVTLSPYNTGTVSVTNGSAVVTGSGTSWSANAKAGDSFRVTGDSGDFYIIQSVDSNTQITLTSNYTGTTDSGKAYGIGKSIASAVVGFEMIIESYAANKWTIRGVGVQPQIHVNTTSDITITASTDTIMTHNNEIIDNNADFSTSRWTPKTPGKYNVTLAITMRVTGAADNNTFQKLFKNGTSMGAGYVMMAESIPQSTSGRPVWTVIVPITVNGSDYFEHYMGIYAWAGICYGVNSISSGFNMFNIMKAERIPD